MDGEARPGAVEHSAGTSYLQVLRPGLPSHLVLQQSLSFTQLSPRGAQTGHSSLTSSQVPPPHGSLPELQVLALQVSAPLQKRPSSQSASKVHSMQVSLTSSQVAPPEHGLLPA